MTFSCKEDCTLTKHTRRWTYSALRYFLNFFKFSLIENLWILFTNARCLWCMLSYVQGHKKKKTYFVGMHSFLLRMLWLKWDYCTVFSILKIQKKILFYKKCNPYQIPRKDWNEIDWKTSMLNNRSPWACIFLLLFQCSQLGYHFSLTCGLPWSSENGGTKALSDFVTLSERKTKSENSHF